ncbi:hypothetical protein ACFL0D_06620 [Thermoproteota archaeon]
MEKRVKSQKQNNYSAFFIIGIALFTIGLGTENIVFGAVGLAMFVLGLADKDKWEKKLQISAHAH